MDFYTLLGLTRTASTSEIDRAYRRLARRYHPGINPGDRVSGEMYRHIVEAHEVLADEDRRTAYDRGGHRSEGPVTASASVSFEGFDFSAPAEGPGAATFSEIFADVFQHAARRATGPESEATLEVDLGLSFERAVFGGVVPLSITRQERCATCGGDGRMSRQPAGCAACQGAGVRRWARGHMVFTAPCEMCGGEGQVASHSCGACDGRGCHRRNEVVTITIPAGIDDGARIVVPGRGHAVPGGPTGDLYIRVGVEPHAFFRRVGRDLQLTLPVAVHEAVLGATVDVPTLQGPVTLDIPPGTPSGGRFRLRGHGVPSASGEAGDLVAEVQIVLPSVTDGRSRALLQEFGRLNAMNVREHLFVR